MAKYRTYIDIDINPNEDGEVVEFVKELAESNADDDFFDPLIAFFLEIQKNNEKNGHFGYKKYEGEQEATS